MPFSFLWRLIRSSVITILRKESPIFKRHAILSRLISMIYKSFLVMWPLFFCKTMLLHFSVNFHNEKSRCTPLSGFLFVRRQILLSPSYFSLSPCKFSLSYKIFFVTNFVTRITKFVTCVRKFVTAVTNFVTNFFCADSKKYQAESKKYHGGNKKYLRDSSGGHG